MRPQFYLSALFLFFTSTSFAINYSGTAIKGNVIDEEKKPLEYVVVTLLKAEDSTLITGMLTSNDGRFLFEGIKSGNYIITLSFTGFNKKWIGPFSTKEDETIVNSDIILSSAKELKEVSVASVQPLFVQKPGMLVMNVENSAVRISGTAYDVVSRAPGVSIDQDGNISLKGRSGAQIYIDGKPTYLSSDQLRDYLMNMPASDIVKIEIMSTPPAKYNAEGSAGIINIVTQKSKKQGFTGSVNAGYGRGFSDKTEAGISLNYGKPNYYIYGKYDFSSPDRKETKIVNRIVYNGAHTTLFDQNVDMDFKLRSQNMKVGADFFPTKNSTLGVRADASYFDRIATLDSRTKITKVDSSSATELHQINLTDAKFKNGSIGFYYNQKLDTAGSELNVSVDYVTYYNRLAETYDLHFLDNYGTENLNPSFQRSNPTTDIGIYVGQIDYAHPFRKKYKVEAGIKSSYVKTSNGLLFEIQDAAGNWQKDTARTNSFIYTEQINAAYLSGTADWGKWQVNAGLRAEQTLSDGNSPTTHQDHRNNYIQLFPTLFVSQKISDSHSMQYTFARRINRPGYDELNPFYFFVDKYLYRVGNPFLQPEIVNSGDITYDYKDFIFASIGGSRTTAGIAQVTHLADPTIGLVNQSSVNLNTIDNGYFNLTFSRSFTKWWTNENNISLNYNQYKANLSGTELNKGNLTYTLYLNETFLLKYGIKLEASAWYESPMIYSIFLIQPNSDVSLGISKSFLKNKLKCTINVSDIFYQQSQHVVVDFADQHLKAIHKFDSRFVYVRLRYNFGKTEAAKKSQFKNAADDLQKRAG